jgi:hypothetical protein
VQRRTGRVLEIVGARREERERASAHVSPGGRAGPRARDHSIVIGNSGLITTARQACAIYLHRMYEFLGVLPHLYVHVRVSQYGRYITPFASFAPIVQTVVCTATWPVHSQHRERLGFGTSTRGDVKDSFPVPPYDTTDGTSYDLHHHMCDAADRPSLGSTRSAINSMGHA